MSQEVYQAIPYRPPFLFLDEILDATEDSACESYDPLKRTPVRGRTLNPIMPGVLLCESVFQAGAVFLSRKLEVDVAGDTTKRTPVLTRIQDAKFKSIVRPGDNLIIEASHTETLGQFYFLKGKVTRDGKTVMTVKFSLAMVEAESAT